MRRYAAVFFLWFRRLSGGPSLAAQHYCSSRLGEGVGCSHLSSFGPIGAHRKAPWPAATGPHSRQGGCVKGLDQGWGICGCAKRSLGRPDVLLVVWNQRTPFRLRTLNPAGALHSTMSPLCSHKIVSVFLKRCWVGFHFCQRGKRPQGVSGCC